MSIPESANALMPPRAAAQENVFSIRHRARPVQQPYPGGGRVTGQHLQHGLVVFVQGELAGGAVPLDLHGLVGEHHLHLLAGPGDGPLGRVGGGGGQWCPPVADPVRSCVPAGGEHARVGPAPVEAQQDRGIRAEDLA
jgi:hypothetical protein